MKLFEITISCLAFYTASSYLGLIMYWLENDMSYTPENMAKQLTNITRLGLPTVIGFSYQGENSNNAIK